MILHGINNKLQKEQAFYISVEEMLGKSPLDVVGNMISIHEMKNNLNTEFALELKDVLEMESLKEEKVFLLFFDELIYSGIRDDNQLGIALLED